MALCATTALAGALSRLCVRGARGRFGGGSGRYLVLCLSCFPLPAPRVPCCVWRAVPSGCPLPSLAGTPFHAVCAFRALGLVALPVLFVCVRSRSRGVRSLPRWVVWRAHLAWSRHWVLVGLFHVVRAPPRVLPRSRAPSGVLGGGRSGPGSPLLGLGLWGRRPLAARPLERAARVPRVPGAVGAGVGSQHRPHSVRPCGPALLAVGVAEGRPWGGAFHRCEGRLVSGAVPPSAARPLERAARVPRPVRPGCGRCGRGDPSPAPQREPLRAGVARCGGGGRASPGGVLSTVVRGAWCQALSLPRPPVLWSGLPGFRDPCFPGAVDTGV